MADENTNVDVKDVEEPKGKVYDQRQWDGLLSDKQKAVQKAQDLESKISKYDSEIENLKAMITSKKEDESLGDPDDVATISTLQKTIRKLEKKIEDTEKKLRDEYTKEKQNESKAASRRRKRSIQRIRLERD
jgi:predicted  nucleic acid-binding Zn-ribbon protein